MTLAAHVNADLKEAAALVERLDPADWADTTDQEQLADMLDAVDRLVAGAETHRRALQEQLAERMPDGIVVYNGLPYERVDSTSRTGWDSDSLSRAVRRWIRYDPRTGEAVTDPDEICDRAFRVLDVAKGRTKVLRSEVGLDLDEYCTTSHRTTVRIHRGGR